VIIFKDPKAIGGKRSDIETLADEIRNLIGFNPGDDICYLVENVLKGKIFVTDSNYVSSSGSLLVRGLSDFDINMIDFLSLRNLYRISHELGHYFLHSSVGGIPIKMDRLCSGRLKWEANWFAAAFTMPAKMFIKEHSLNQGILHLSVKFNVPWDVVRIRKASLGLS
jgi:Zn-dependent peptidase ImmA (M78 family)